MWDVTPLCIGLSSFATSTVLLFSDSYRFYGQFTSKHRLWSSFPTVQRVISSNLWSFQLNSIKFKNRNGNWWLFCHLSFHQKKNLKKMSISQDLEKKNWNWNFSGQSSNINVKFYLIFWPTLLLDSYFPYSTNIWKRQKKKHFRSTKSYDIL